ncbi:hypothetical protein GW835_00355 [archaeon]|nr:hypothetical protein [archaeon]NCP79007.1 hypothetical protein [archaeon]NCP97610.1 hypothetical protein [archaeon]NCQ06774.1 hypothetical protein [archaeon]NCQ50570.1 hypothetical protein [archaeon]
MPKTNLPSLKKNKMITDLKKSHTVSHYKGFATKLKGTTDKVLKKHMLIERNLVNYKILSVRVSNKLKNLPVEDKKKALSLLNKIYNKLNLLEEKNCCLKYFEFSKVFAEKINRKKGREVLEILMEISKKYI